jgi:spore coat protein U-like protein
MRKYLLITTGLALIGAGAALAADSGSVQITATQQDSCQIDSMSSSLDLGNVVDTPVVGDFQYRCTFVGSPQLTFTSANGGVETSSNGGATADYGIYLNDAAPSSPPSTWLQASAATGGVTYTNITTTVAPNTTVAPSFQVGLTQPLTVSGTYTDTLTVDIAP